MSVDGIGGGGRPPKAGDSGAPVHDDPIEAPSGFDANPATEAAAAEVPSALEQVRGGTLSLDQYVDIRVEQAVQHLKQTLPTDELDFVRASLRDQMRADPVLVELLQRATGLRDADADA
jgi:hypothetical protein